MRKSIRIVLVVSLASILGAAGFIGGFVVGNSAPSAASAGVTAGSDKPSKLAQRLTEVQSTLKREALTPPSETSATAGAIQGLLDSSGDKYALYFNAKHFEYFSEEMSGQFGGIGVSLGEREGTAYVVEVFADAPAKKAGMKAGDVFAQIDGVRRDRWTTQEVVKRVRGEEGTDVKLTMLRPGKKGVPGKEYTVTITRAQVSYPNLRSSMKGDVGYIRLAQFNDKASVDVADAVRELEKQGAKSLVLDLRDNPGGSLQQAIAVTSLFIESGTVVRVDERGRDPILHKATGQPITDAPMVLLMNTNSASASEIVGGALQDYDRAVIVGETSFGKGSVQTVKTLSFGGAIKYTIAHYLTPKGRVIDGKGVVPDVAVAMDADKQGDDKTDTQLRRAVSEAQGKAK